MADKLLTMNDQQINDALTLPGFLLYYDFLISENEKYNLTAITKKEDVYQKHFYDSLVLAKYLPLKDKTLLDVGAGAGFPSVPLKIVEPSLKVTIIDALNKRIHFLSQLKTLLGLDDIKAIHGRAEEHEHKNHYDIVTSRAVAKMNILTELCLPFVKVGGYFIAYKSMHYQDELEEAKPAIRRLCGQLEKIIPYDVSDDQSHVLIIIKKTKTTDALFPRAYAKIKKQPL